MPRALPARASGVDLEGVKFARPDAPRRVRSTVIDFSSLSLPEDVRLALAEAFWSHIGVQVERGIHTHWFNIKTFDRFARETRMLGGLATVNHHLLARYVEWLNAQCRPDGQPWSKWSRANAYSTLRKLLQWLERCRPGVIDSIEYPYNPFPWRNRDGQPREKMPARELRALLKACETEIVQIRALREAANAERSSADSSLATLGGLLEHIDRHFDGIVPSARELSRAGRNPIRVALSQFGGLKGVEPCLYPRAESLLPYYLAILIHSAGNPDPIAELARDCLQSLPLLEDRQALVWLKRRASSIQRRTFSSQNRFEPPALVDEVLQWNERLRPLASDTDRDRLFLFKSAQGISALSSSTAKHLVKPFLRTPRAPQVCTRRPSGRVCCRVATGSSGDLRRTQDAWPTTRSCATTVRYVETPAGTGAEHPASASPSLAKRVHRVTSDNVTSHRLRSRLTARTERPCAALPVEAK